MSSRIKCSTCGAESINTGNAVLHCSSCYEESREMFLKIIDDLVFAYANKDEDLPHYFERIALHSACNVLQGDKKKFALDVYNKIIKQCGTLEEK